MSKSDRHPEGVEILSHLSPFTKVQVMLAMHGDFEELEIVATDRGLLVCDFIVQSHIPPPFHSKSVLKNTCRSDGNESFPLVIRS